MVQRCEWAFPPTCLAFLSLVLSFFLEKKEEHCASTGASMNKSGRMLRRCRGRRRVNDTGRRKDRTGCGLIQGFNGRATGFRIWGQSSQEHGEYAPN